MGRKEKAAEPISSTEENMLWETKQLGDSSPYALLQTVWYLQYDAIWLEGCDEHRRVCLGDFKIGTDSEGIEYVEFNTERGTKTRKGVEWEENRPFNPRMYATTDEKKCPVRYFTKYMSL